jgi:hypothetical protein
MIDNFIYLDICEILYKEGFKRSKFTTFTNYCNILKLNLKANELNVRDYQSVLNIYKHLDLVYCLTDEETTKCFREFLALDSEAIHQFYLCVISSEGLVFHQ